MHNEDLPQFAKLLAEVFAGYGKSLTDAKEIGLWFKQLSPFPPATIRKAFEAYRMERPDFAPVPNGIVARCKLLDGRPDENEAWAVAITSQDERETVVWTNEMAEAFGLARPLLDAGDEIGARMAFKDAYKRLVDDARASNKPVQWSVSAGWDASRRQIAVEKAIVAGLLAGPQPHLALPNESGISQAEPEGLKRLKEAMAQLHDQNARAAEQYEAQIAEQEKEERARREAIDQKVRDYLAAHPEARYGQLLKASLTDKTPSA
jgi:hypothetical protein